MKNTVTHFVYTMQLFNWIAKIRQILLKIEVVVTIGILVSMMVIATIQIIMRNLFDSGLLWTESYIRVAVLWLALLGAMLASRNHKHLAIDTLIHRLTKPTQYWLQRFNDLFSAIICFIISYHSSLFIYSEYQQGSIAFAIIPSWLCEVIIPVAFVLIGCRYLLIAIVPLSDG